MRRLFLYLQQLIRNTTGFSNGRSFPISFFRLRGNRQLLIFAILSLPVVLAFQIPSVLNRQMMGITLRQFAIFCSLLILIGIAWSAVWMRTRYVHIRRKGLVVLLPFARVRINWKAITDFEAININQLYPPESLTTAQQRKLGRHYTPSGILIHLKPKSLGFKRWLIPWPLLGDDINELFLPVNEWELLSARLPNIINGKIEKKEKVDSFKQAARQVRSDQLDILCVSAGGRELGQLANQLDSTFSSIEMASEGIEAIRIFRSKRPKLILIDTHLPAGLSPQSIIKSINQYGNGSKSSVIIVTKHPIKPDLEIELFEAGIKEVLDLKRSIQLAAHRVEFWVNWQEQMSNLARRNQELYGQNLHQKSELARHGALMNFLPKDVAEEVIAGKFMKEAAKLRKQTVTVLFADIVGFTPISAQLDVDTLAELLNDYLQRMTEVVVNHGGIVDKFIGDEVMAIFGAPDEEPETVQVQNAFSAALSMVEVVKAMDYVWENRLPAELNIRAGINTGICTAGLFGSESLRSYTVIGSPVNLAARLTSAAPPGGIATCANSLKWVKMRTKYSELGYIPLKGIVKPVDIYQIHEVEDLDLIQ